MTGGRRPVLATYRLQLTPAFGFDDAAALVPYLARLGVSHLYTSPFLQAAPGSTHGYDVVDHSRVNDELGGPAAYQRLLDVLDDHGLGLVADVVPNHMAVGVPAANRWWWDVLEDGPASPWADHFDIDWDPPEAKLAGQILVPVLGDHYGRALEAGELRLVRDGPAFDVEYFEHRFPVAPRTLDGLLAEAAERAGSDELAFLADAHGALPRATDPDQESRRRRHRDKVVLRSLLERLIDAQPAVAIALDEVVSSHNSDPDRVDQLLDRQNYRLARWRTAAQELDYRRFFDIPTLAALRTDRSHVWDDVHRLVLDAYRTGALDGLRIDHPDGLADPAGYLERLEAEAPEAWVVVEKILEPGEALPPWPVAGTTGYDFAHQVGGLWIDAEGEGPLTQLYRSFTGEEADYASVVTAGKRLVLQRVLAADLARLVHDLSQVCERHRRVRDFTRAELVDALEAVTVHFPVYRTYLRAGHPPAPVDQAVVVEAVAAARAERADVDGELFDLLERLLLLGVDDPAGDRVALRFQQLTGPTMAKGVEDTAFYRYHRLICLNEVGGDPGCFGVSVAAFHQRNREMAERWPATMLATSTHDTKRSEDVRARIALLSEIPERWAEAVERWSALNERHRRDGLPDRNAEYLLYQTLVGAHPLPLERALGFMEKASREAKQHTSWIDPGPAYDEALADFVRDVLADERFVADLDGFVEPLVEPGRVNGLAQTLLKLTSPGVADLYQGSELWTDGLVDPDNRRPVDFALRRRLLDEARTLGPEELWKRAEEGLPKLAVVIRALDVRRRWPELFRPGPDSAYQPLAAAGPRVDHVVAFGRGTGVCVVVPRLPLRLAAAGGWGDTTVNLPAGRWRSELELDGGAAAVDGGQRRVADLLARFPVAVLTAAAEDR